MRICIENDLYDGTPVEIMEQLWDGTFDRELFGNLDQYLDYMAASFERLTDMPVKPEGRTREEKAKALLLALAEIDALEVLEDA